MVSIIIPTYNRSKYLVEAVESCLTQTFQNIEIIIIDDGSTDGTEEMLEHSLNKEWLNLPITYLKQKNAGASAARNFGLAHAKGDFIQFLDSDDLLYPNKLELQLAEIEKNNADVCSCYGEMGSAFGSAENEILGVPFENKLDLMHKMCSGSVHIMQTTAPLWRKSFLDDNDGWNESLAFGDDLEYHIRLLTKVSKICFVSEKLFFVREHSDLRLSDAKGNIKQIESGIKTLQMVTEILLLYGLWDQTFEKGILKNSRSLYLNYLKIADIKKIDDFEKWVIEITNKSKNKDQLLLLILFRKIFGKVFLIQSYNFYSRIKNVS